MGQATVLFHAILVAAQILLLRKAFKIKNLLQIPADFIPLAGEGMMLAVSQVSKVRFISDGDILRWLSLEHSLFVYADNAQETFNRNVSALMNMSVAEISRKHVITVDCHDDMTRVCAVLSEEHLKKVPVVDGDRLVGIINASNITKYILRQM